MLKIKEKKTFTVDMNDDFVSQLKNKKVNLLSNRTNVWPIDIYDLIFFTFEKHKSYENKIHQNVSYWKIKAKPRQKSVLFYILQVLQLFFFFTNLESFLFSNSNLSMASIQIPQLSIICLFLDINSEIIITIEYKDHLSFCFW